MFCFSVIRLNFANKQMSEKPSSSLDRKFFFFGCIESPLLCGLFSSGGEQRLLSSCMLGLLTAVASLGVEQGLWGVQASEVAAHGLSSWGSWLWSTGSLVVAHRPSCSVACGIFLDQGSNSDVSCIGRWILYC